MAYILQQGCTIMCPHGGTATVVPSNTRVRAGGGFALLPTDTFIIAGCPFTVGTKYQPCVTIRWLSPAARVRVGGTPVLTTNSVGLCQSAEQAVQGTAVVTGFQVRVSAQ